MATPTQYVQTNTLYIAGSGVVVGATSITLTSFTDIYGNILTMSSFGTLGFITLEPDTTNEESATFTGVTSNANGTYTLTGIKTTLAQSPYTQTSGLIRAHSGGTKVVVTDNVAFWNTFANKSNDEVITGTWTFQNFPITPTNPAATDTIPGIATLKVHNFAADAGTANAYFIAPTPPVSSYLAGQIFTFTALNTNTGASTLNVNGLGIKNIKKNAIIDLVAGDILNGQMIMVEYDGTNFQLLTPPSTIVTDTPPVIRKFTATNRLGDTSTQFTITNPTGTTFRYTYTGTGTSPGDFTTKLSVGQIFNIQSTAFSAGNRGLFTVTAVHPTYLEVTNASGVAEATKLLTNGYMEIGTNYAPTAGTKWIEVEVQGAGYCGANGSGAGTGSAVGGYGGGAGGYLKKIFTSAFFNLQIIVGQGIPNSGIGGVGQLPAGTSAFGPGVFCTGGFATLAGVATGGDINIQGGGAMYGAYPGVGGQGGSSPLGGGGASLGGNNPGSTGGIGAGGSGGGSGGGNQNGADGSNGMVIITEHFI